MRTDRPDEVSRVRQAVDIANPYDPPSSEAPRPEATRLGLPVLIGVTWIPLGWWTAALLGNHVFALLGCTSPAPPHPVMRHETAAAVFLVALWTLSSSAVCRRGECLRPTTEWTFFLAVFVISAASTLYGILAIVLATDMSLPNSPDESTPGLVVVIAICLQSLMAVLIGSVTALRLFTWRLTVRRRLTAATVLLVLLGAALVALSDIGSQLLCA